MEVRSLQVGVPVKNRAAARKPNQRLYIRAVLVQMGGVVPQRELIVCVKLMVQPERTLVLPCREGEQSAILFKLVHDEGIRGGVCWADKRIGSRVGIYGEKALQRKSTG